MISALINAINNFDSKRAVRFIQKITKTSPITSSGILDLAARTGLHEVAVRLILTGSPVNGDNNSGSALRIAIEHRHHYLAELLIALGATTTAEKEHLKNNNVAQQELLFWTLSQDDPALTNKLVTYLQENDLLIKQDLTPLIRFALSKNKKQLAKTLLAYNTGVNDDLQYPDRLSTASWYISNASFDILPELAEVLLNTSNEEKSEAKSHEIRLKDLAPTADEILLAMQQLPLFKHKAVVLRLIETTTHQSPSQTREYKKDMSAYNNHKNVYETAIHLYESRNYVKLSDFLTSNKNELFETLISNQFIPLIRLYAFDNSLLISHTTSLISNKISLFNVALKVLTQKIRGLARVNYNQTIEEKSTNLVEKYFNNDKEFFLSSLMRETELELGINLQFCNYNANKLSLHLTSEFLGQQPKLQQNLITKKVPYIFLKCGVEVTQENMPADSYLIKAVQHKQHKIILSFLNSNNIASLEKTSKNLYDLCQDFKRNHKKDICQKSVISSIEIFGNYKINFLEPTTDPDIFIEWIKRNKDSIHNERKLPEDIELLKQFITSINDDAKRWQALGCKKYFPVDLNWCWLIIIVLSYISVGLSIYGLAVTVPRRNAIADVMRNTSYPYYTGLYGTQIRNCWNGAPNDARSVSSFCADNNQKECESICSEFLRNELPFGFSVSGMIVGGILILTALCVAGNKAMPNQRYEETDRHIPSFRTRNFYNQLVTGKVLQSNVELKNNMKTNNTLCLTPCIAFSFFCLFSMHKNSSRYQTLIEIANEEAQQILQKKVAQLPQVADHAIEIIEEENDDDEKKEDDTIDSQSFTITDEPQYTSTVSLAKLSLFARREQKQDNDAYEPLLSSSQVSL